MNTGEPKALLEVCCGDCVSFGAAVGEGVIRVELCSGLEIDGLTPSYGLIDYCADARCDVFTNILIRPRGGNFVYSGFEKLVMQSDIRLAVLWFMHAVVVGALMPNGDIDTRAMETFVKDAGSLPGGVTFHRAFDYCRHPHQALETLISLGCKSVLTSGQAPTAWEGRKLIRELVEQADGRITIIAAGGINSQNVAQLIEETGVTEVHASAKSIDPQTLIVDPTGKMIIADMNFARSTRQGIADILNAIPKC